MGYRIGKLASLPTIEGKSLYVFVLGQRMWHGGLLEIIDKNFNRLAKEIGPKGAVIMGHEGVDLSYELVNAMYDNGPDGIQEIIADGNSGDGAILILGEHPNSIQKNDMVLYAPLAHLDANFNGLQQFLSELCEFANNRNADFINKFHEPNDGIFTRVMSILELKPNIFGIGINLNALVAQ